MTTLTELEALADAAATLDHNEAAEWYSAESMETYAFYPKNARFIAAAGPQTIKQLIALCRLQHEAIHWAQQELIMWDHSEGGADFEYLDSPCVGALALFDEFEKEE